jgi:hypothetical protein
VIASVVYNQLVYTFASLRISGAAVHLPAAAVVVGAGRADPGRHTGRAARRSIMGSIRLFVNFALAKLALRDPYPADEAPRLKFQVSSARCCTSNPPSNAAKSNLIPFMP